MDARRLLALPIEVSAPLEPARRGDGENRGAAGAVETIEEIRLLVALRPRRDRVRSVGNRRMSARGLAAVRPELHCVVVRNMLSISVSATLLMKLDQV